MYQPVFHTSLIVLSLLISIHNIFVLVLYSMERCLKSITNFLLINLACCDLMTGIVFLPLMVAYSVAENRLLMFIVNIVTDMSIVITVLSLTSVVSERYIHLCHPFKYSNIVSRRRVRLLVAFMWLFAILVSIAPISWSLEELHAPEHSDGFLKANQFHSVVLLFMFFFIPTCLLLFSLVSMFWTVRRLNSKDTTVSVANRKKREKRVALIFLFMYLCLVFCWMPMIIIRLLLDLQVKLPEIPRWVFELFVVLRALPSLTNPFVYVWCKTDFRQCVVKLQPFQRFSLYKTETNPQTASIPLNPNRAESSLV